MLLYILIILLLIAWAIIIPAVITMYAVGAATALFKKFQGDEGDDLVPVLFSFTYLFGLAVMALILWIEQLCGWQQSEPSIGTLVSGFMGGFILAVCAVKLCAKLLRWDCRFVTWYRLKLVVLGTERYPKLERW